VPEFAWFDRLLAVCTDSAGAASADREVVGADGLEPPTYAV
jgi:hypothetical protein